LFLQFGNIKTGCWPFGFKSILPQNLIIAAIGDKITV